MNHDPLSEIEHSVVHIWMPWVSSRRTGFKIAIVPVRVVLDNIFHPNMEISVGLTILLLRRNDWGCATKDFPHVVISTIAQAVGIVGGTAIRDPLGRTGIVIAESVRDVD